MEKIVVVNWDSGGSFPLLKDVKDRFLHPDSKLLSGTEGTNSTVETYGRDGSGPEISIRTSKLSSFRIFKTPGVMSCGHVEPYNQDIYKKLKQLDDHINDVNAGVMAGNILKCHAEKNIEENKKNTTLEVEKYKKEIIQKSRDSVYNWLESSKNGLSPELYFYGYIKGNCNPVGGGPGEELFLCIVNKAYDTDLYDFYKSGPGKTAPSKDVDEYIANQLLDLFNKMITPPLELLCFDIKPQNCVMNMANYEVKLIDWDEDWCAKIPVKLLEKGALTRFYSMVGELYEQFNILNQIIMANHFYYYLGRNIFRNYFLRNKDMFDLNIDSLRALFCSPHARNYQEMASHYFKIYMGNCEDLFNKIYKRCFLLNKHDKTKIGPCHNPSAGLLVDKDMLLKEKSQLPGFTKTHEEFDLWNTVDESVEPPSMDSHLELMRKIQSANELPMDCQISDKSPDQMQGVLDDVYPHAPSPISGMTETRYPGAKQATLQHDDLDLLAHVASRPVAAASLPAAAASLPADAAVDWEKSLRCSETIGGSKKKKTKRNHKKKKKKKSKKRR
jgi:hypothetical protein